MATGQSDADELIAGMVPDEAAIQSRKDFLQFGERESALLNELQPLEDAFVHSLFEHLQVAVELQSKDAATPNRPQLQPFAAEHFGRLLTGGFGPDHVRGCLEIGVHCQQTGLEPRWYLGAYAQSLSRLLPSLMQHAQGDSARFVEYCQALIKAALLDFELSLSAYFHADHEMLRLLAQVFKSNHEGVIIATKEGRMLHANDAVGVISGYAQGELVGQAITKLCGQGGMLLEGEGWKRALSGEQWHGEVEMRRPSGEHYPSWMNLSAVRDELGEVTHIVAEFSDITAFKQAQTALQQRTDELARSNRELEQFAYVASHDLQEPLRMVASYTQLLARRYKDKLDDDANEFIHYAVDGATRMQALINDLLALSRIGTRGRALEPCQSGYALERALANLRLAIEESGATVTHDFMPEVFADVSQLTQLLQNLIGNGLKFCGEAKPEIHVGAERRLRDWLFSVRDNGIGIAPEYFERIFVIFQRLHGKHEYPGTGIGLALCKKIVERHQGSIWLESQPGCGTVFYFTLPAGVQEGNQDGE